ncbi:MAG: flagellar basal body rod protein FlgC [Acidimicrobiales bacterium]
MIFSAIQTAGSALRVYRTWMDAVGDNIANLNTIKPTSEDAFQARYVVAKAADYGTGQQGIGNGSKVAGVLFGDREGRVIYQPDHPLADAEGMVRYPDMDLSDQMTQLLISQRGYQANLAVVDRVKDAYLQALQLGK